MNYCPCGSGKTFDECCQLLLSEKRDAATAEELMRSRYTAYVKADAEYILKTTHPDTRKQYTIASINSWAKSSTWIKLEVLSTSLGKESDTTGEVKFKAYYLTPKNEPVVHNEHSRFIKEKGKWYFLNGEVN